MNGQHLKKVFIITFASIWIRVFYLDTEYFKHRTHHGCSTPSWSQYRAYEVLLSRLNSWGASPRCLEATLRPSTKNTIPMAGREVAGQLQSALSHFNNPWMWCGWGDGQTGCAEQQCAHWVFNRINLTKTTIIATRHTTHYNLCFSA